jgi:hypothetical protein
MCTNYGRGSPYSAGVSAVPRKPVVFLSRFKVAIAAFCFLHFPEIEFAEASFRCDRYG